MHQSIMHRLFWGIVLVAVGVVFLLNQTGVTTFDIGDLFKTFWPVFIILFGLQGLLIQRAGGFWWNPIVIMIGVIFLGRNLGWFTWNVGDMFSLLGPVALILFGVNMMAGGSRARRRKHRGDWSGNGWNPVTPPPVPPTPPQAPLEPQGPPPAPPLSDDPNASFSSAETKTSSPETSSGHTHWSEERHREKEERWHQRVQEREERWRQKQQHREERRRHHGQWWDHSYDPGRQEHSRFIGDVHIGHDYWELRPMSISHFIGDTTLDLTKAQIPLGETRIYVSCFIGDVKVFVPNDLGVGIQVVSSSLIGDVKVLDHKRGGFFNQMTVETPSYSDTDKRVVLIASSFIGDVRVTKVG
jgi:lia operon protein LiaF